MAPPPAALTASPSRIELAGAASGTIRIANPGRFDAVVEASPAGFGLDLRGRPHIVVRHDPSVHVSVRPRRVALRPDGAVSIVVSSTVGLHARPGDHAGLVVLATRPRRSGGVSVRMQVGVVVLVRVAGAVVHRLDVRSLRMRPRRLLVLTLRNRGNVVERVGPRTLRVVLRRGGRVLATLPAAARELLPGARGIVELRVPSRVHGRVRASIDLAGRRASKTFPIRVR